MHRVFIGLTAVAAAGTNSALGQTTSPGVTPETDNARISTTVFVCPASDTRTGFEFTVRHGSGEMALWLPFEFGRPYLVLSQVPDEPVKTFREGDVEVMLEPSLAGLAVGAERFSNCAADPVRSVWEHAKLSGMDYRATGTNPDWTLELRDGGDLVLRTDIASAVIGAPTPEPETDRQLGQTHYRAVIDGQALVITIGGPACSPADGIESVGSSVTIRWGSRELIGCGRALH